MLMSKNLLKNSGAKMWLKIQANFKLSLILFYEKVNLER